MRALAVAALVLAVPLAAALVPEPAAPARVIVGLAPGVDLPAAGSWAFGARVDRAIPDLDAVVLDARDPARAVAVALADERVAYAEIDSPFAVGAHGANDPYWPQMWGAHRVRIDTAWATTRGSEDVLVAVLDSGLATGHEDFQGVAIRPGINVRSTVPSTDVTDVCGHGTHVTGTIAARTDNAVGVAGLARVTILPVKVLDQTAAGCRGSYEVISLGILAAVAEGADVISMSLGGSSGSALMKQAVDLATASGSLVVVSAGNDGCVRATPGCVQYPAAYPNAFAVGCTTPSDARCSFSNGDPSLDIAAPGWAVWSTTPWGYAAWYGTSMAAPHVSAVAALMKSVNPDATPAEIALWISETATDLGPPGRDVEFGAGLLDAPRAVARAQVG